MWLRVGVWIQFVGVSAIFAFKGLGDPVAAREWACQPSRSIRFSASCGDFAEYGPVKMETSAFF